MAQKSVKYKLMYLAESNATEDKLPGLMQEAASGEVLICHSQREIESHLKDKEKQGWALKIKTRLNDWGFLLYMEQI